MCVLVDVTVRGGGGRRDQPPGPFSLHDGGPLYRLGISLGHHHLGILLVLIAWAPLLVITMTTSAATGRFDDRFLNWSIQVRLLVALPLLLVADVVLGVFTRRAMEIVLEDDLAPGRGDAVRALLAGTTHRLRSALPEAIMVLLALVGSQLVSTGSFESLGIARGRALTGWTPFTIWYRLVSLPLYQFVVFRALWGWFQWWRLLWRLSRLPLRPIATHPDKQGGLGFLAGPSRGFALVLLAINAIQAGAWWDKLDATGAELSTLAPQLVGSVLLSLILALGPLVAFAWSMWREAYHGGLDFDRLSRDYASRFKARWMEGRSREELLGTADLQSLADLGNSYERVDSMRFLPIGLRTVVVVVVATLLPVIPLLLRNMSATELLQKLIGMAIGKFV
jgi:hypothetical protein